MTADAYEEMLPRLKTQALKLLRAKFRNIPRDVHDDAVQMALIQAMNRRQTLLNERAASTYVNESARLNLQGWIRKRDRGQFADTSGLPAPLPSRDAGSTIVEKIDLERAIMRAQCSPEVKEALGERFLSGWTREELALKLPPTKSLKAWKMVLERAEERVRTLLVEMGYDGQ